MGRIQYYLVNHSRKEFCSVDLRKKPVLEEINRAFTEHTAWKRTENIFVEAQDESHGSDLWDHLTMNLEYKDLDYDEHAGP